LVLLILITEELGAGDSLIINSIALEGYQANAVPIRK